MKYVNIWRATLLSVGMLFLFAPFNSTAAIVAYNLELDGFDRLGY